MGRILIILFLILWFANFHIAGYLYPDYLTDGNDYGNFIRARENINEIMMLLLLSVYFLKKDKIVRSLFGSSIVLVTCSIIDKVFQGVLTYAYSDIVVIGFAIFIGIYIFKNDR